MATRANREKAKKARPGFQANYTKLERETQEAIHMANRAISSLKALKSFLAKRISDTVRTFRTTRTFRTVGLKEYDQDIMTWFQDRPNHYQTKLRNPRIVQETQCKSAKVFKGPIN